MTEANKIKTKRKLKIGVMGSASGPSTSREIAVKASKEVGRAIALKDCLLLTGACPGLPHEALCSAKAEGGYTIGVSPAFSHHEHVQEYKSPDDNFDIIFYSGMGFMERDIVNIRSSDGLIFLGGGVGTLNEFTVAYEEGKPAAILEGIGGISAHIKEILTWCNRPIHPNLVFSSNPEELLDMLIGAIHKYPTPIHEDGRVTDVKFGKLRG